MALVTHAVREREGGCNGKMQEGIEVEKVLSLEKMRQETEQAKLELQKQKLTLIREGKVAADVLLTDNPSIPSGTSGRPVDVWCGLRLVPRFNERS